MHTYYRWLTGPDDLPACALLTVCSGGPGAIADNAEAIYGSLRQSGFIGGNHLQTAAFAFATRLLDRLPKRSFREFTIRPSKNLGMLP
jgi:hypothetical protein